MNNAPEKKLWRRADVRDFLGVDDRQITELVRQKLLNPFYTKPGTRAFYKRAEVMKLGGEK